MCRFDIPAVEGLTPSTAGFSLHSRAVFARGQQLLPHDLALGGRVDCQPDSVSLYGNDVNPSASYLSVDTTTA